MKEKQIQLKNTIVKKCACSIGFTLIEICVVLVIIGIMLTFALPQFAATKEHLLDKEAKSTLALLRAAEKIYKMEYTAYYPTSLTGVPGVAVDVSQINAFLKLSLPDNSNTPWQPEVNSITGKAKSTRRGAGQRVWTIDLAGDADPSCAGSRCPP